MNCHQAAKLFNDYQAKELSSKDISHLEEHLRMCQACFGHTEFDQRLRELIKKKMLQPQLSSDIKKLLRQKLSL